MLAYVRHGLATRGFERRVSGEATTEAPRNAYALRKVWNTEVKVWAAPWWAENSSSRRTKRTLRVRRTMSRAYASGLAALGAALGNFSASRHGRRRGRRVGFPRYKRRSARRSFTVSTGFGLADARHLRLPRIGPLRTKEPMGALVKMLERGEARMLGVTVSETAGRWFASIRVAARSHGPAFEAARRPKAVAGVDLGIKHLATVVVVEARRDGTVAETVEVAPNEKHLARYQRRLARQARAVARRQRGSKRHRRAQLALQKTHAAVAAARRDSLHKLNTALARTCGTIVVEDLNVSGMVRNHHLAKAVSDASFAEVRRQLTYKTTWRGGRLVVADRFYPSSKTCSACGAVKAKLPLAERTYTCEHCGVVCDRDVNAARNLAWLGLAGQAVAASGAETRNARGEASAGRAAIRRNHPAKLASSGGARSASFARTAHKKREERMRSCWATDRGPVLLTSDPFYEGVRH